MKKLILALFAICLFASTGWPASKSGDYELQEKCAKNAKKFFENDGWFMDYENHYNKKLNKCFIVMYHELSNRLVDINENKIYGEFWMNGKGEVTRCYVKEKVCRTPSQWESFIRSYMEE